MAVASHEQHRAALLFNVHPPGWQNPEPRNPYNLVAVGGGTAGLVAAVGSAALGARVALVERMLLGGDCLHHGCVPSKAIIRGARAAAEARAPERLGIGETGPVVIDFRAVMERLEKLQLQLSHHDSAERLRQLGIDLFLGDARFTSPRTLEVDGQELRFRRAVIATGARPAIPPIPGLAETGYRTNETIFSLAELPRRLMVLGAGPMGCELAQAFARLGSDVHLVQRGQRLLPRDEPEAGERLLRRFEAEEIHVHLGWRVERVDRTGDAKGAVLERSGERRKLIVDEVLVAAGRRPSVGGLGLEEAGVCYTQHGVVVNDFLRTTNRRIYAAGDICGGFQFTHAADAMARLCVQNALFLGRRRLSALAIPWCTYTDPEIAHVGITAAEAAARRIPLESFRAELADVDRAVLDGDEEGFAVVHARPGSGRILGGTIVAPHASELIGQLSLAMSRRLSLWNLAEVVHCYPTQAEVFKRIADQFRRSRLMPRLVRLARVWHACRRLWG